MTKPDAAAKYPPAEFMQAWRAEAEFKGLHERAIGWHLIRKACDWQREQDALNCENDAALEGVHLAEKIRRMPPPTN